MKYPKMNMGILKRKRFVPFKFWDLDSCMERWQMKWAGEYILNLDRQTWSGKKIKPPQTVPNHCILYRRALEAAAIVLHVCRQTVLLFVSVCLMNYLCIMYKLFITYCKRDKRNGLSNILMLYLISILWICCSFASVTPLGFGDE